MESVGQAWRRLQKNLEEAGIDPAPREGQRMVQYVLDFDNASLLAQERRELSVNDTSILEIILKRRLKNEPLDYILELADFAGREWRVTADVLIPRPDTETLLQAVLEKLPDDGLVVEVGLGSGAVLGSVLLAKLGTRGVGIEISPEALMLAEGNLERVGVLERCTLFEGDLLAPLNSHADVIFSNPPYIPEAEWAELEACVREFEPKIALTAGVDGLDVYRRLITQAFAKLKPDGVLAVEVGFGQGEDVSALFKAAGFVKIEIKNDLAERPRVVLGVAAKSFFA